MLRTQRISRDVLLGLLAALVIVGVSSQVTYAAELKEEMTISPTDKHYSVNAGDTITDDFAILNSGQVAYDFTTYSAPYSVVDTDYNANTSKSEGRADAFQWIQFTQSSWHAGVRDTVKVPFTIHVSKFASPGGHYAVIFAEEKPTSKAAAAGVTRNIRMGMIVYINVKGNAVSKGNVDHIGINWFQPSAPLTAEARINNTGETDFPVSANFVISDIFGHVKYTQKMADVYVLPGAPRDLTMKWNDSPWLGLYKVQVGVQFMNTTTVKESYVIIAPRWLIFVLGLIILLGVARAIRALSGGRKTTRR